MMQALTTHKRPILVTTQNYFAPFIFCTIYGLLSQYLVLSMLAGLVLTLISYQFLKPYTPPALFYWFSIQWLQIFGVLLCADFAGQTMDTLMETNNAEFVITMAFLQLAAMCLTATIFYRDNTGSRWKMLKAIVQLNVNKVITGYLICLVIFPVLFTVTQSNGTLSQIVRALSAIKSTFFVLLVFLLFTKGEKKPIIITIIVVEFLLGFVTFFSPFKEIIICVILAYITIGGKFKASMMLKIAPLAVFVVILMIWYSQVKPGYRDYLNGGTRQQAITVSKSEAFDYLTDHIQTFTMQDFHDGTNALLDRIQAMRYYLQVYDRVPKLIPFANGSNTSSSISFLVMPRFLDANKQVLDPSTKLSYYSGRRYANAEEGTSIAMGYFCDFYVDFGIWGMFIPLLLVGALIGWMANLIIKNKNYNPLFNYALAISIFLYMATMDGDIIFFFGMIRNYLVLLVLGNLFIFPWINKYISK